MTQVQATIKQRGTQYGDYREQTKTARTIKREIEKHTEKFTDVQREALDMIAVKISRLINGDPNHKDGWLDIAGYATLVINELEKATDKKGNASARSDLEQQAIKAAREIQQDGIAV